jgi:hypothetical protein
MQLSLLELRLQQLLLVELELVLLRQPQELVLLALLAQLSLPWQRPQEQELA